jgi:hypothetical protein
MLLLTTTIPAHASEMDGRWFLNDVGAKSCSPSYESDDKALVISGGGWDFAETYCDTTLHGSRLSMTCYGEGQTWKAEETVRFAGNKMTRTSDGYTFHYTRCPEAK